MAKIIVFLVFFISILVLVQFFASPIKLNLPQLQPSPTPQVAINNDLILPDLLILPPQQMYITTDAGNKKIRFSTTAVNIGKGKLELIGNSNPQSQTTKATQVIQQQDKTTVKKEIGEFVFHPGHDHWHVENFTKFELWSIKNDREFDSMLASTSKMSFCLWDEKPYKEGVNESSRQYLSACENNIQGISPGWSDTYPAFFPNQELDINNIEDGKYAIQEVINPDKNILESNFNNNNSIIYVEILNDQVTKI